MNWFNVVDQKCTDDNYVLNILFYDEGWNPFLWPLWQTEEEMDFVCPLTCAWVSKDWAMETPLLALFFLQAKVILLSLSGSSIWSKQKRGCEPADTLYDMYWYRSCRGLWVTFAHVREGMAGRKEGGLLPTPWQNNFLFYGKQQIRNTFWGSAG